MEVKRWAVWINHLRLWLTLFVDMPNEFQHSFEPLLPNLTFKVRVGDSLVQRIGGKTFPVQGHANLPATVKRRITELKKKKRDFFYNKNMDPRLIEKEELDVFRGILDAEIEERRKAIRELRQPVPRNRVMFQELAKIEAKRVAEEQRRREVQIAALQAEIEHLQAQKGLLKDERPFIWSLEFAEIFFDRGGFDIIIGNPPYVRQEEISDPNGRLSVKDYKEALLEMVRLDFPDYFARSRAETDRFRKGRKPSGRSDLYTYFYIRSLRLLNPQGVHVFICSNAWLDVGYGAWLQEFFLRQAPLHLVIDNHAKRSFARADVNTVITVASAPRRVPEDHVVRFVAFKQPFEDAVLTENLLAIENATGILKTDAFRVFPITVRELLTEGSDGGKYVGDKWGGKYLRAPDVFHKIFTIYRNFFRPLRRFATIEGYIHGNNIGPNYPKARVIESIEDAEYLLVDENSPGVKDIGVLHKGTSRTLADLLYPRMVSQRFAVLLVNGQLYGQKFYKIILQEGLDKELFAALLNTSFTYGFNEIFGNVPWGQGAISVNGPDVEKLPVFSPEYLSRRQQSEIIGIFRKLAKRRIETIFTECGIDPESDVPIAEQEPNPLPDRKALDDIVFDALGLTEEERKEVYRAVCQLVWERISKARSV